MTLEEAIEHYEGKAEGYAEEYNQQIADWLKELKELKDYVKGLDEKAGYKDDPIFLLSIEEYEKYKDSIPVIRCWWWLRSPGDIQNTAAYVDFYGSVYYYGDSVNYSDDCVRPALNLSNLNFSNLKFVNEDTLVYCGTTWKKIDENLYISETGIGFQRFDEESNDYETSEIRKYLLAWHEERKSW